MPYIGRKLILLRNSPTSRRTQIFVRHDMCIVLVPRSFFKAIAVACHDVDVRNVKALIIGPPETPYEFGFFEVGGNA